VDLVLQLDCTVELEQLELRKKKKMIVLETKRRTATGAHAGRLHVRGHPPIVGVYRMAPQGPHPMNQNIHGSYFHRRSPDTLKLSCVSQKPGYMCN
jgi:hypothetical protein